MSVLSVRNLRVRYTAKGPEILKGIDFDVEGDDFLAMIGPSGAGKSTLIRCVNRLVEPTGGQITLLGQDVCALNARQLRGLRRNVGMIFQEFNLINRMSVMDNVLSGRLGYTSNIRSLFRHFPKKDISQALDYLDRVGLGEHINKRADELSGGQRQRVGIARALMQQPKLLLLDEPSLGIAPKLVQDIARSIVAINRDEGVSVLLVEQNSRMALSISHRAYAMATGNIVIEGNSKELLHDDRIKAAYLGGEV